MNYVEATRRAVIDISEVRRVFVATIVMELQYRASGPLRSICDRWSGLLVVIHLFREPEPWVHRLLPDRVAGRRKGRRVERTYCNPADRWVAVSFPNKAWCRNSGRNEFESDNRCRRRARRPSAPHRAAPALSDSWHRYGKRCQCRAGTLCSGTTRRSCGPVKKRSWRSDAEAARRHRYRHARQS